MVLPSPAARPLATILVVDDAPDNLAVIGGLLEPHYRVRVANSGARALRAATTPPLPDLILLDRMMPGMDGMEVLGHLKADPTTRHLPVIFVTSMDSDEDEEDGLTRGAVDYVTKPIRSAILLARIRAHLEIKQARDWLADQNGFLEAEVGRRMRENELVKDASLQALANMAETRDPETGNHIARTQAYVEILARRLSVHPDFSAVLPEGRIRLMVKASPLHDLGKVGIPDHVLLKPGRLTQEEFEIMKRHAQMGGDAIGEAMRKVADPALGGGVPESSLAFLAEARDIALTHHERWDGAGYPRGLRGEAIPLSGRIMALADVFDALSCRRVYREALPFAAVAGMIEEGRGTLFDPRIVDAFKETQDRFLDVARRFAQPGGRREP